MPRTAPAASSVLRLTFGGGNSTARAVGLGEQPGKSNYFIGRNPRDWLTDVPTYAGVKYERILPGIDLVFYGRRRQLEFDFMVAPGADPTAIRFAVDTGQSSGLRTERDQWSIAEDNGPRTTDYRQRRPSSETVRVDQSGDMVIRTDGGEIRFHKPIVYQEIASVLSGPLSVAQPHGQRTSSLFIPESQIPNRQLMDAGYVLRAEEDETGESKNENRRLSSTRPKFEVSFEIASYDPTKPLTIDPVLSYSTYLGGSGLDYVEGIAVDAAGNAYVVGRTNSPEFPLAGAVQSASGGGTCGSDLDVYPCFDAFVSKLNAAGTGLVYSTYIGGSGEDYGMGIAVDASGNAYVTGYTNSADFPLADPLQPSLGGGYDAFALKLDSQGSAVAYSTYLGGSGNDYACGVAASPGGEALLAGFTASSDFPTTAGAGQEAYAGGPHDAFVSRLASTGMALIYSTYLGGSGEDFASDIATDASGNAFVTGYTNSADFPVAGAFQADYAGGVCGAEPSTFPCYDAFVSKLNAADGTFDYSTYLGGSGSDYGHGIAVDGDGNAFVAGETTSADFPVSDGAFQTTGGGASVDAFVAKLDASGASAAYSTYLGGLGAEAASDVAVDGPGNAYVTGYNLGAGFPMASPLQPAPGGHFDTILAKVNDAGTALVFSTYLGGSDQDRANAVAVDSSGGAYVTGGTFSTDLPVTAEALQIAYAGGSFEGFVAKVSGLRLPVVTPREASLTFPDQGVATTSPARTVTLSNSGDADLAISTATASGDFVQSNDCASLLPPGGRCTLDITFTPTAMGPRMGSIAVEHSAWGNPFVVHLVGNGVAAPAVEISPLALSFGEQSLGTTSASQTAALRNTGDALLIFSSISTSEDFAQTDTCGPSLAVDDECALTVTFTPWVPGAIAGAVSIFDNAPGSPHVLTLTGTGLGPAVSLSPASLAFGDQLVETASSPLALTLTNSGNRPLEVASITASGDFAQSNDCAASLSPGDSCTILVTFAPSARGMQTGALTVSHNGLDSPSSMSLTGTGVAPVIDLSSSQIQFDDQPVGTTSSPQTITLANSGDAPLNILGIEATGDFAQTNNCPGSLAADDQCAISVTFAPAVAGSRTGMVAITHNPSGESLTVALSGIATDFSISASPASTTIVAGEKAIYSITLEPIAGFSGHLSLTCSGAPKAATCSVLPEEVSVDGTGSGTATVTVATTARALAPAAAGKLGEFPTPPPVALAVFWLLMLVCLAAAGWVSPRHRARFALGGVLLCAALWVACGGGGSASVPTQGTPAGEYTLTVTAASDGISRSATLSLRVN